MPCGRVTANGVPQWAQERVTGAVVMLRRAVCGRLCLNACCAADPRSTRPYLLDQLCVAPTVGPAQPGLRGCHPAGIFARYWPGVIPLPHRQQRPGWSAGRSRARPSGSASVPWFRRWSSWLAPLPLITLEQPLPLLGRPLIGRAVESVQIGALSIRGARQAGRPAAHACAAPAHAPDPHAVAEPGGCMSRALRPVEHLRGVPGHRSPARTIRGSSDQA